MILSSLTVLEDYSYYHLYSKTTDRSDTSRKCFIPYNDVKKAGCTTLGLLSLHDVLNGSD